MTHALRPSVAPPTRRRRRLQVAAAFAGLHLRTTFVPETSIRRRQRVQICGAARILTALGVRVRVVGPPTPWPRHRPCRLVVGDDAGWLAGLALVTSVPRTTAGWRAVCAQVLPGTTAGELRPDDDAVACPVTFRYRSDDGPLDRPPRTVAEIVATPGLVVEVHLLQALDLATRDQRSPTAPTALAS
jgi:hypothetical protein